MNTHPETALVPYLRDQLEPDEQARVAAHLDACSACHRALADARAVLAQLQDVPAPPEPHWGRYRAELRAKLEARARGPRRWRRPMPIAVSTGLAAAVLLFTLRPTPVDPPPAASLTPIEETALGARLDMLKHYDIVQRLDMLDEMETVRNLDVVPTGGR
jgi:anti-sigma factor RsiW